MMMRTMNCLLRLLIAQLEAYGLDITEKFNICNFAEQQHIVLLWRQHLKYEDFF